MARKNRSGGFQWNVLKVSKGKILSWLFFLSLFIPSVFSFTVFKFHLHDFYSYYLGLVLYFLATLTLITRILPRPCFILIIAAVMTSEFNERINKVLSNLSNSKTKTLSKNWSWVLFQCRSSRFSSFIIWKRHCWNSLGLFKVKEGREKKHKEKS